MHPNFVCIGAQKAGTQWLYDQAASHPGVWMPPIKEVKYFVRRFNRTRAAAERRLAAKKAAGADERDLDFYHRVCALDPDPGKKSVADYATLFEPADGLATGDVSPQYVRLDETQIGSLAEGLPDCRFVMLLREPVSRFWSMVNMHIRLEQQPPALATDPRLLQAHLEEEIVRILSFQSVTVERWRGLLGPERFRVFVMDDLIADPENFRRDLFGYIGLDAARCGIAAGFNKKAAHTSQPMSAGVADFLEERFGAERARLQALVGGSTLAWARASDRGEG